LGWKPKYTLPMIVKEMVESDLNLFEKDQFLKASGFNVKNEFE
jgi:GDPmannose 4,6-dehydratase